MDIYDIDRYDPTLLGKMKKAKYGDYVDIDDYEHKMNRIENKTQRKLITQRNNHEHINGALMDTAKALSTLPEKTKKQFIMAMLRVSPETHKIIVQLKHE